ncbi:DUF4326 domain-containing protein [Methylosinus sp. RM1]|uniref:DUF4326 domain-containing protein n=1 Tax=Methylosinus sp. RM1 TaxID=2583817 RepID=UPI00140AC1C1|nr:DUF4326 domain-containing protein [Methylosinus sp. RM1]
MNALDSGRTFPDRDASPAAAARDQIRESGPSGTVRLGNKRKGAAAKPRPGESVVDIDRCNPILGNPFILQNHRDDARRAEVIALYKKKYDADLARGGPMAAATEKLAERVRAGERLILMCWCHGAPLDKPCHGDLIKAQIERRLAFTCD